jgi:hypothetical protein
MEVPPSWKGVTEDSMTEKAGTLIHLTIQFLLYLILVH